MPLTWSVAALVGIVVSTRLAGPAMLAQTANDCVTIGTPKPSLEYTYRRTASKGGPSDYSHRWEEVTTTGSRVRTTGPRTGDVSVTVNRHHIVDDVSVIDASTASGTNASGPYVNTTTYQPGVVGDPAFRACAGRSWPIGRVTASHESKQGKFSAQSDPGILKMVAIHEPVTVPAGRFDTIHYSRSTTSAQGPVTDEYWKSIEHGVIVKHSSTLPSATSMEILLTIK